MGGRMTTGRQSIRRWARAPPDQVESAVGEGSTKPWAGPFCAPAGRPTSGRTAGAERFPIDRAITTDPPAAGETRSYADRALELPARDAGQANMRLIGNSASSLERWDTTEVQTRAHPKLEGPIKSACCQKSKKILWCDFQNSEKSGPPQKSEFSRTAHPGCQKCPTARNGRRTVSSPGNYAPAPICETDRQVVTRGAARRVGCAHRSQRVMSGAAHPAVWGKAWGR
jgi:hypothetical protein